MTSLRKLAPEEFPILKQVHEGFQPDPKTSIAVLADENDEIVGRVFLMAPVHVEGPWVRDDKRGSTLGARLMSRAELEARECGVTKLFAYAANGQLADYLERLGYKKQPFTVWAKDIR